MQVVLEKMVHGGRALGRLKDGQIVLVSGGIPGEHVEIDVSEKKGVLQGRVSKVLEADEYRLTASDHPGLDYSFMQYEKQLELKREVVIDALSRSLKRDVSMRPVQPSPDLWHYRNTVQPFVKKGKLAYQKPKSHDLHFLDHDPVAMLAINDFWQVWSQYQVPKGIRQLVFRTNEKGELLISLIATSPAKLLLGFAHELLAAGVAGVSYAAYDPRGRFRSGTERLAGKRFIQQAYGPFEISVTTSNFAQPNPKAASELYKTLLSIAPTGKTALDLYAGSGIIGMHLAEKFDRVIALDINRASIARGKQDAKRLGIDTLSFVQARANALSLPKGLDLICVDPPRAGLNKEVREHIDETDASCLIYVSCDVATWSRDVSAFLAKGWQLDYAQPFDFYPQTHHIEMLSCLKR